jgi:cyclase
MLARRIIPVMLQRGSTLVKGARFNGWRSVGHAQQAVAIHQARGVDEMIYLDIAATPERRGPNIALVEQLTRECFMPITVGGGVRSVEDVRALLRAGADKVAIGTAAIEVPAIVQNIAREFGCQAVTVSIDVRDGQVWSRCGQEPTNWRPEIWAAIMADAGAGEILVTSINREGTLEGYDLELVHAVSQAVDVPVIANGGAGSYEHLLEGIRAGASAVAVGALFQFTEATPRGAANYLHQHGVEVRIT